MALKSTLNTILYCQQLFKSVHNAIEKKISVSCNVYNGANSSLFPTDWYNFTIYDLYEVQAINNSVWPRMVDVSGDVTEVTRITLDLARDEPRRNVNASHWNVTQKN